MAKTAMAALKELVDSEEFLASIRFTTPSGAAASGAYFQKPPDDVDLSTGDVFIFDFKSESWDYTTESILKNLTCSVIAYCNSFERADQIVQPALEDVLMDAESRITILGHESYNLTILQVMKGLLDVEDKVGNPVYFVELELQLEYQRKRRGSDDAFSD